MQMNPIRNTWCHRRAQNLRECIEHEYEIESEESHPTSCPNKYIWNGKDHRDC